MQKQRHCEEIRNSDAKSGMDDVAISYFRLKHKSTFNNR